VDHKQTIAMLTWINQVDPRVMLNEANAETWAYAMAPIEQHEAKQAVLEHYKANENIAASPAAIRKRALNIRSSRDAGQSAITAKPSAPKHPMSWRARNPELWDQLFAQGRAEGNAARKALTERRSAA
jgi:histidinol-phosphate/aromatic aminotransferase/cobyric acid decarboxylase-like protein